VVGCDISAAVLELTRARFADQRHVSLHVNAADALPP